MKAEYLERCLLSTTPFISLREMEGESVIRLWANLRNDPSDYLLLIKVDGVYDVVGCTIRPGALTDGLSQPQVIHHLRDRLVSEAGLSWELIDYSNGLLNVACRSETQGEEQIISFIGKTEVCRYKVVAGEPALGIKEFGLSLLGTHSAGLAASLCSHVQNGIHSLPYATNEAQREIDDALRAVLRLPRDLALGFEQIVLRDAGLTVEGYCRKYPRDALNRLADSVRFRLNHRIIQIAYYDNVGGDNKVFSTESSGRELRIRSGLEAAALLNHHIIFIELAPTAVFVSHSFIQGLLEQSVVTEGSWESFWNRYKFIGFDKHFKILTDSVKFMFDDHLTLRNHHGINSGSRTSRLR